MATDAQAWDVLFALADKLGIDPAEAQKADGKPSDVFMAHIRRIERERDELAAHVGQMDDPATVFIENVDEAVEMLRSRGAAENIVCLCRDLSAAADQMVKALGSKPATSLARRDARTKAEALEEMALMFAPESSARADCLLMREAYLNLTKEES